MFVKVNFPEGRLVPGEVAADRNDKMPGHYCNYRSPGKEGGNHLFFQQIEFDGVSGGAIIFMRRGVLRGRSLPATAGMPVCNCRSVVGLTMTDNEEIADKGNQQ
jgi:hypothetical protein